MEKSPGWRRDFCIQTLTPAANSELWSGDVVKAPSNYAGVAARLGLGKNQAQPVLQRFKR